MTDMEGRLAQRVREERVRLLGLGLAFVGTLVPIVSVYGCFFSCGWDTTWLLSEPSVWLALGVFAWLPLGLAAAALVFPSERANSPLAAVLVGAPFVIALLMLGTLIFLAFSGNLVIFFVPEGMALFFAGCIVFANSAIRAARLERAQSGSGAP